jgi:hypothetical protein
MNFLPQSKYVSFQRQNDCKKVRGDQMGQGEDSAGTNASLTVDF